MFSSVFVLLEVADNETIELSVVEVERNEDEETEDKDLNSLCLGVDGAVVAAFLVVLAADADADAFDVRVFVDFEILVNVRI